MGNIYNQEGDCLLFEDGLDINDLAEFAFNLERNIKRDSKGRLNKGSRLAHKDNCNEERIKSFLGLGYSVKHIAAMLYCSKSTVYRIKKQYDEQQAEQRNERSDFM